MADISTVSRKNRHLAIILGTFGAIYLFGAATTLTLGGREPKTFAKTSEGPLEDAFYLEDKEQYPVMNFSLPENAEVCGAPIAALDDGIVLEISDRGWNEGRGSYVIIEGLKKMTYLHLGKIFVTEGQLIGKGEAIAVTGKTGLPEGSVCVREAD